MCAEADLCAECGATMSRQGLGCGPAPAGVPEGIVVGGLADATRRGRNVAHKWEAMYINEELAGREPRAEIDNMEQKSEKQSELIRDYLGQLYIWFGAADLKRSDNTNL